MKKYIIIAFALTSCKSVMVVPMNPTPSLKGLHIWDHHRDYNKEQFIAHPNYDCTTTKQ